MREALTRAQIKLVHATEEAAFARDEASRLREKLQRTEQNSILLKDTADSEANDIRMYRELETRLNKRCAVQEDEILELRDLLDTAQAEITALRETGAVQADQIKILRQECNELRQERDRLQQAHLEHRAEENAEAKAIEKKRIQLDRREERLRLYADSLSAQKAEFQQISKQLAEEIHQARTLHPLKDYLSLTEFELSKIELQLKKTPTSSMDRPALEATLTQMMEQRDFLRTTIDASQKELSQHASVVFRLGDDDGLVATPPPPPRHTRTERPRG
jgi:chromosome segregation ATPase